MQVPVTAAGTAHAIVFWWNLNLDNARRICLSTAPAWVASADAGADADCHQDSVKVSNNSMPLTFELPKQQWRDHWKQCWAAVQPSVSVGKCNAIAGTDVTSAVA